MKKEFVPYGLALRLKKLGFDEPCFGYFVELKNPTEGILIMDKCENNIDGVLAPTFSQCFRWFREKHKFTSAVLPFQDVEDNIKLCYYYCLVDFDEAENEDILCNESSLGASDINFSSYEEAELACLDKLLEIVEQK